MMLAHISDTHLGYAQYGLSEREEDIYEAFREAFGKAFEERVEVIVHSGDFFHTPRPPIRALKVAQDVLREARDRGVRVYAVPGSHDMLKRRGVTPLVLYEHLGLRVLTSRNPCDEFGGVLFAGFEHVPRYRAERAMDLLAELGSRAAGYRRSVLVMHQGLDIAHPIAYEFRAAHLPRGFTYYAMGHIHRRMVREVEGMTIAYAGSTEILEVGEIGGYETEGKGFYLVDLSGDSPDVQGVDLECVRPQVVVGEEAAPKLLQGGFPKPPVVHLRVADPSRPATVRLVEALKKRCLHVRVIPIVGDAEEGAAPPEPVRLEDLLVRELGAEVGAFAGRLVDFLSSGSVEEAIREAEEFFRSGRWRGAKL